MAKIIKVIKHEEDYFEENHIVEIRHEDYSAPTLVVGRIQKIHDNSIVLDTSKKFNSSSLEVEINDIREMRHYE